MAVGDARVFFGSLTPVLTTFLSKAIDYFHYMLLQRLEAKIRRKEMLPQPGHESDTLTTVTRAGQHTGCGTRDNPVVLCIFRDHL